MARFGFCAGTYQSQSSNVDAQRCINWYPEVVESGDGASAIALYPTPGLKQFAFLGGNRVRGMYEYNGRVFVVSDKFYEVFSDGTSTGYNNIPDDGLPVTMAANNANQLAICGGGQLWLFPLVGLNTASLASVQFFPSRPIGPHGSTAPFFQATLSSTPPFAVGATVYFSGVTAAPGLNGTSLIINQISGNAISGRGGTAVNGFLTPSTLTSTTGQVSTAQTGQITTGLAGTPYMVDFVDGYFALLLANSTMFQTSNLEDGTTWDPSFIYQTNEYPGNALSMISNFRELWIFGAKKSLVYYDSGDPLTPMQPIPGAFVEHGINAPWSVARLDNSVFWLGADERGRNVAWRSQGYTPVRVSTHGVEALWERYPTLSDAIGYSTSKTGHGWWHLYFPSADASWRYDTTTGMWHEVASLKTSGQLGAHRSRTHVLAFEKNLVGDDASGMVYEMSETFYEDDTPDHPHNPIKRIRRAPHVINEHEWMFHHKMRVLLATGQGPTPPFTGAAEGVVQLAFPDPTGQYWMANITDQGVWESQAYPPGEQAIVSYSNLWFADLAYLPYQVITYYIGPDTYGVIWATPVAATPQNQSRYITHLPLQTWPSGLQTGLSIQFGRLVIDPPVLAPVQPQVMLRWSDDGGHTWSNEYLCGSGFAGEFKRRVEWRRLGRSRDRIYEISTSDAIPWRIVDAYLDVTDPQGQGYKPVQRYAHQAGKVQ